jgi:putative transposase
VVAAKPGTPVKAGTAHRPVTELEAENSQLKRALAEMKMERDLLKESDGVLREGIAVRYALMMIPTALVLRGEGETLCKQFPVTLMSRVFDVSKSGYYTWLKRPPSSRAQDNARLEVAIKAAHVRTRQSYGPER